MCGSWAAPTTSSTSPATGSRPGAMEEVLASHPDVAECAVVGAKDQLKGQAPIGLVVLKAGVARAEPDIVTELVAMVRDRIGPVAAFKDARVVARLPKTRSGKILRASIRRIADGEPAAPQPPSRTRRRWTKWGGRWGERFSATGNQSISRG